MPAPAEDGASLSASFIDPFGITIDEEGNVIVADGGQSNCIRRITPRGKVLSSYRKFKAKDHIDGRI
jgi:hypothetical protein